MKYKKLLDKMCFIKRAFEDEIPSPNHKIVNSQPSVTNKSHQRYFYYVEF